MLIYLHGVSSSGKSTIGNALLNHLNNAILIDKDTYYKKIKPVVTIYDIKTNFKYFIRYRHKSNR